MTPRDFVRIYFPDALASEKKTGFSALAICAQGAWESGWGEHAPGNALFGVKDTDGINGNEQLLITTEYSKRADLKFPVIIKIEVVTIKGERFFKYTIKDYFRRYNTPEECFSDHASFFVRNVNFHAALEVKSDPYKFIDAIAAAGYATDPNYAKNLKSIVGMIQKEAINLNLIKS